MIGQFMNDIGFHFNFSPTQLSLTQSIDLVEVCSAPFRIPSTNAPAARVSSSLKCFPTNCNAMGAPSYRSGPVYLLHSR